MGALPWIRFRNLCRYYIDCTKYSEKSQEYLFSDQLNVNFLLPPFPVNWHLKEEFDIDTDKKQRYMRSKLLSLDESEDIYIGYPLSSFISTRGFHCLCPLLLFPVSVRPIDVGRTTGLHVEVERQGIDINSDWVEYHVPRQQQEYFRAACERTSDGLGMVDIETVLSFIANFLKMEVDPNCLDCSLRHSDAPHGILNTAVIFIGNKTQYTRTLIRELNRIKDEPDAVLDGTALAYVFRDPVLQPVNDRSGAERRIPAVFTNQPMNGHQHKAVEMALNAPVTKITGPPGTGKSHVSVNIVANEVYNGGSVLFTSKNHKAIHAVFDMCQQARPDADIDLMTFCTAPGNDASAQWDAMQERLDQIKDCVALRMRRSTSDCLHGDIPREIGSPAQDDVDAGLSRFRDAAECLEKYDALRERISCIERLIVETDRLLEKIPLPERSSEAFRRQLASIKASLDQEPRTGVWCRLLNVFKRFFRKTSQLSFVCRQLNDLVPGIAPAYSRPSSVSKSVRRLLKLLHFRDIVEQWRENELEVIRQEASECNYDEVKQSLSDASNQIGKCIKDAYVEKQCMRVAAENTDDLLSKIKGALKECADPPMSFMSLTGNAERYQKSLELFTSFLHVFPAWAVTLLSLRRASPCLPGVFSLVVIDEAAQCEIPPLIPALFRAKRVVVVGDPAQFPPVVTLKSKRNDALRKRYNLLNAEMNKYSFCENSAFSVIPDKNAASIHLVEHFRCMDDIAMYFNEEYYHGELCPCVDTRVAQDYNAYNLKPGMAWTDVKGGDEEEGEEALNYLKTLKDHGFLGSVGVISPLRKVAEKMKTRCFAESSRMPVGLSDERINTANAFQGGQCDVILFLLGLNRNRTEGEKWYITAEENKYIYNVSVSRAKVCFVTFGDKSAALASGISRIIKLIPNQQKRPDMKIGPGEICLYNALVKAGLSPKQQYPVLGRYLDLALVPEKIDIEVDGQAWHLDRNGCRKADDIHRDLLMETNGWTVLRFWHHEVINDIQGCVDKIKQAMRDK